MSGLIVFFGILCLAQNGEPAYGGKEIAHSFCTFAGEIVWEAAQATYIRFAIVGFSGILRLFDWV